MYHMVFHIQVNKVQCNFNVLSCNSLCVFFLASTSGIQILTSSKDNLEDSRSFAVVWKMYMIEISRDQDMFLISWDQKYVISYQSVQFWYEITWKILVPTELWVITF